MSAETFYEGYHTLKNAAQSVLVDFSKDLHNSTIKPVGSNRHPATALKLLKNLILVFAQFQKRSEVG